MPLKKLLYFSYEKLLEKGVKKGEMPTHLGLILDGNRRYAKEMGYEDVSMGHKLGAKKLDDVLQWCADLNIKIVTIWVLSTDNTQRDREEVDALLRVIKEKIEELEKSHVIKKNGFKIKTLGRIDMLPDELKKVIKHAEESTMLHTNHILNIAIGYGGREEIVEAVKKAVREKKVSTIEELAIALPPRISQVIFTPTGSRIRI